MLDEQEMLEIVEEIARNSSNQSARIQAIKLLREIGAGERTPAEGFEALDELAQRRPYRTKAA